MMILSRSYLILLAGLMLTGCAGGIHFTADETTPEEPFYYENLDEDTGEKRPITNLLAGEN